MNENSNHTELLIQYLDGELEGDALESVKKNIEADPAIREELENLLLAKKAVASYGLYNKIQDIHSEMMQELKEKSKTKQGITRMIFQYSSRIAAVLIILFGISALYQYYTVTPEKLFNEKFQRFELREMRGAKANTLSEIYKSGDMKAVIRSFDSLINPQQEDYFLAGNAFLNQHEPAKAIDMFTRLAQLNASLNTQYFEDAAEYYLALSYLSNGQAAQSLPILEKIHEDKNHPYNQQVGSWFILRVKKTLPH